MATAIASVRVYAFAERVQVRTKDPSVIGRELERIEEKHGKLTSALLVKESKRPTAALHAEFMRDDAAAGPQYREIQAAALIRSVVVTHEDPGAAPRSVRAFYNVVEDGKHVYRNEGAVYRAPDLREQVRRQILSELESARRRLKNFEEWADVGPHLDGAIGALKDKGK